MYSYNYNVQNCVPLEGKFILLALVIVRITLNMIVLQMSAKHGVSIVQKIVVKHSNTSTTFSQQEEITAIMLKVELTTITLTLSHIQVIGLTDR